MRQRWKSSKLSSRSGMGSMDAGFEESEIVSTMLVRIWAVLLRIVSDEVQSGQGRAVMVTIKHLHCLASTPMHIDLTLAQSSEDLEESQEGGLVALGAG